MNRENYVNDYPVEPMSGYGYRNHMNNFKSPNQNQMPLPPPPSHQAYQYQTSTASDFSYYPGPMGPSFEAMQYDQKFLGGYEDPQNYWRGYEGGQVPPIPPPNQQAYVPPNIVQRISLMIQSQLPYLREIMKKAVSSSLNRREKARVQSSSPSKSRSRSRDKRRSRDNSGWLCNKCSFPNFQWRNNCKRCSQSREALKVVPSKLKEWKCPTCQNLNYARRRQCNRCGKIKDSSQ